MITQQLKNHEQILLMDGIRAARTTWEAERERDLEQIKIECAEAARRDLMATETKVSGKTKDSSLSR